MPTEREYGERVYPTGAAPRLLAEHLERYRFAARSAAGRRVLDLGCGTGYGAEVLHAAGARATVGVEVAEEACLSAPRGPSRWIICADAAHLPLRSSSFEACVAIEVIEHVLDQQRLVAELARVLVPGAPLVISTPNRLSRTIPHDNPFHPRELSALELERLLLPRFRVVRWAGQYFETGGPLDQVRRWSATSPLAERLRRLLPWRARTAAGNVLFGHGTVEEVDRIRGRQPSTLIVVATRS